MLAKIQKWGNSLGVRIPKQLVKNINLKEGSSVKVISSDKSLIITLDEDPLDVVLDKITNSNLHSENFICDSSKGRESW